MFSSSPGLICMWEAKGQDLGLVWPKQNASMCAGLEEGGSHTDRGAGPSNGLIVLPQSCLQEFMGQVVPSDYPNNLKEEEERKKRHKSLSEVCHYETSRLKWSFFSTPQKEETWKQLLINAEREWIQVEIHRNNLPLPTLTLQARMLIQLHPKKQL